MLLAPEELGVKAPILRMGGQPEELALLPYVGSARGPP